MFQRRQALRLIVMQGHSAAVKEAVGAGLMGCKAPFRLVQDHSRSGRLEASSLALRKWLFSDAFEAYFKLIHVHPHPSASHSSHLLTCWTPHPPPLPLYVAILQQTLVLDGPTNCFESLYIGDQRFKLGTDVFAARMFL